MWGGKKLWPTLTGADTKPWEVLIFLATHPASGVSREAIVSALWPDDPEANANHRLRQLRYRLRSALERSIPDFEDDPIRLDHGVLSLDPGVAHSDAQEFLALLDAAREAGPDAAMPLYEQARGLYAGDLLGAPDARRFAWLDERAESGLTLRETFRAQFHAITIRLAQLYVDAARLDDATALYQELTIADGGDESLWRALFRVLAARGDRRGLVREERRMRRALQELEGEGRGNHAAAAIAEPSEETVRELQRLREGLQAGERTPSLA
jgi:DNA-binding SARP family transcriptional activator